MNIHLVRTIVLITVLAAAAVLVILDVFLASDQVKGNTISEIALAAGKARPIVPLIVGLILGILFGHLWWPQ